MEFEGTTTRGADADPELIIDYCMRPVLIAIGLASVGQHAAAAAVIKSQSVTSV